MLARKFAFDKNKVFYLLCLGNINPADVNFTKLFNTHIRTLNVIDPKVLNITRRISQKKYYELLMNNNQEIRVITFNRGFVTSTINDLTFAYRNLKYNVNSYVKLYEKFKSLLKKLEHSEKEVFLVIVYDNNISVIEKQILSLFLKRDRKDLTSYNINLIFHHNEELQYYLVKYGDKIYQDSINYILKKHTDYGKDIVQPETKATDELKVEQIKLSKIINIFTDSEILPKQSRKELYDKLTDMIIDVFNAVGLPVISIDYEIINNVSDIEGDIIRRYTVRFKLPFNDEEDVVIFDVPEIVENSYFYLNGTRRVLQYQLINNPIIVIKPGKVKLHTLYAPVTLEKKGKKKPIWKLYAAGLNLNPVLVFLAQDRLDSFAKLFGVRVEFIEK
ncbi:MAG: hypothetical protein QW251_05280 [Desulfurococcaceae archaeon]